MSFNLKKENNKLLITIPFSSNEIISISIPEISNKPLKVLTEGFQPSLNNPSSLCKTIELDEMEIDLCSSAIEFINYLPNENALIIQFWDANCYCYYNVPEIIYALLIISESKGRIYQSYIKNKFKGDIIPNNYTVEDIKNNIKKYKAINNTLSALEILQPEDSITFDSIKNKIKSKEPLSEYEKLLTDNDQYLQKELIYSNNQNENYQYNNNPHKSKEKIVGYKIISQLNKNNIPTIESPPASLKKGEYLIEISADGVETIVQSNLIF